MIPTLWPARKHCPVSNTSYPIQPPINMDLTLSLSNRGAFANHSHCGLALGTKVLEFLILYNFAIEVFQKWVGIVELFSFSAILAGFRTSWQASGLFCGICAVAWRAGPAIAECVVGRAVGLHCFTLNICHVEGTISPPFHTVICVPKSRRALS